jgi:hypothetical protein
MTVLPELGSDLSELSGSGVVGHQDLDARAVQEVFEGGLVLG